jgi:[FeFe] hydrogenase H-cluster maturation GTPase HydF
MSGLNETPSGSRVHIGIFGRRNAGKSSIINAITGQDVAIVSDVKGTTTDPVAKAMELLPLGPVKIFDTPGLDDEGELGMERMKRSIQVLNKSDIALLIVDGTEGLGDLEFELIEKFKEKNTPYLIVYNKIDLLTEETLENIKAKPKAPTDIYVSAVTKENILELKELIAKMAPDDETKFQLIGDLLSPSDFVVLVIPIDKAAPKGRLILPQQQTIRDILESDAIAVMTKEYELRETLENLGRKPKLVITDSQVFAKVSADTPKDVLMTSFSILFARHKGNLETLVKGVKAMEHLKDGDKVLISEGCTHHRQCDDIGTVKIPRWIKQNTGKMLEFEFSSGSSFPEDLSAYSLIVHCGGCTLNEKEMKYRIRVATRQNVPITNYGILIAYMQGILKRSLEPFPAIAMYLEEDN